MTSHGIEQEVRKHEADGKGKVAMNGCRVKFCPQCGADDLATREITLNHVLELYCPDCGVIAVLLCRDHSLIGTTAAHDPDSDAEAW